VALPERDPETGLVRKVFPHMNKEIRPLFFREAEVALRQARAAALRDSLGVLYVALTRARHALHIFLAADDPEKEPEPKKTYSWLLRWSLKLGDRQLEEGDVIEYGDPEWAAAADREPGPGPAATDAATVADALAGDEGETSEFGIRLRAASARRRLVPHTSPSALEGGGLVDLRWALRLDSAPARDRGTIAHAWLERIGWIEDGAPEDEELRRIARELRPRIADDDLGRLLTDFHRWLEKPTVREALSRAAYGEEARVETELSFAVRAGDAVLRGFIDRLILLGPSDSPHSAEVIDFKTDAVGEDSVELERRAAFYAPQLQAYREAVAHAFGLGLKSVTGRLVFLEAGYNS
jgi:ATP-dependent exoDNAse (exonuclease V) beta subunit